mgnify:CR=1 FL=1
MSFEGLDAVYTLDDAQVLAGLTRVERAAHRHAGFIDRAWNQAGRSMDKFFTRVNLPRATFLGVAAAVGLVTKAVKEYNREYPELAIQSAAVGRAKNAWGGLRDTIAEAARGLSIYADEALRLGDGGGINTLKEVFDQAAFLSGMGAEVLSEGASSLVGRRSFDPGVVHDYIAGYDWTGNIAKSAKDATIESRREMAFQRLMGEAMGAGRGGDPIHAAEARAQRNTREAREKYAKMASEGIITPEQSRILAEVVNQQGQAEVDAARAKVFRDNRAGAAREQKRLDEENAAAAKATALSRERVSDDLESLRIQEMKLRGLDKEAELAEAALRFERQRREIAQDEALTQEERNIALAEVERLSDSTLSLIAAGQGGASRVSYRGLGANSGFAELRRGYFGPAGAQPTAAANPVLAESRKQTTILAEIRDRVGQPAVYGN